MIYIVLVFVLALPITFIILRALRGIDHGQDYLEHSLSELLRRGYDSGLLIVRISYTKMFIQFTKYIRKDRYGIEFVFPRVKWAMAFFDDVERICREMVPSRCCIINTNELDYLSVDFFHDTALAAECMRKLLVSVFGIKENTKLFYRLENASMFDELIDTVCGNKTKDQIRTEDNQ